MLSPGAFFFKRNINTFAQHLWVKYPAQTMHPAMEESPGSDASADPVPAPEMRGSALPVQFVIHWFPISHPIQLAYYLIFVTYTC